MNRTDELMKQLAQIEKQKKQLNDSEDAIKQELFSMMQKKGISMLESVSIKVYMIGEQTRFKIDADKLKKAHPEIAAQYGKITNVKPFCKVRYLG